MPPAIAKKPPAAKAAKAKKPKAAKGKANKPTGKYAEIGGVIVHTGLPKSSFKAMSKSADFSRFSEESLPMLRDLAGKFIETIVTKGVDAMMSKKNPPQTLSAKHVAEALKGMKLEAI